MRFVLAVEGGTEKRVLQAFLERWLNAELPQRVGVQIVSLNGYGNFRRKIEKTARNHLHGPDNNEIIAVIGLMDLYGPQFYPDHLAQPEERRQWGVTHFQQKVDQDRFRMFFAVHELEAWLLSQPDIFPREVRSAIQSISSQPENVNFDAPPAKRLHDIYRSRLKKDYKKVTNGKRLFSKLDPMAAADKCPHLKAMLEEMLTLARQTHR